MATFSISEAESPLPFQPGASPRSLDASNCRDWEEVSCALLEDGFILTALELHTELLECGREVSTLKDYFSNPGNFEHAIPQPPSSSELLCTLKCGRGRKYYPVTLDSRSSFLFFFFCSSFSVLLFLFIFFLHLPFSLFPSMHLFSSTCMDVCACLCGCVHVHSKHAWGCVNYKHTHLLSCSSYLQSVDI